MILTEGVSLYQKWLMLDVPPDCAFAPLCWKAQGQCCSQRPELAGEIPAAACFYPEV